MIFKKHDTNSKFKNYGTNFKLDKLVDGEFKDRIAAVEKCYGLDILVNDDDEFVRQAVARKGYGLDILINDSHYRVRRVVANQGYGLEVLINDTEFDVRQAVAEQGYGLDVLINDDVDYVRSGCYYSEAWPEFCTNNWETLVHSKYSDVRIAVAKRGYGLNILIHDEDSDVSHAVNTYLKEHNLTLEQWIDINVEQINQ